MELYIVSIQHLGDILLYNRRYADDPASVIGNVSPRVFFELCMNFTSDFIKNGENVKAAMKDIVDSVQLAEIEYLFYGDLCERLTFFTRKENCYIFAYGSSSQGLVVLISNYMLNMRTVMKLHEDNLKVNSTENILDSTLLSDGSIF